MALLACSRECTVAARHSIAPKQLMRTAYDPKCRQRGSECEARPSAIASIFSNRGTPAAAVRSMTSFLALPVRLLVSPASKCYHYTLKARPQGFFLVWLCLPSTLYSRPEMRLCEVAIHHCMVSFSSLLFSI